eukprot:CAMPEP_0116893464 /NCGR_PEP_ID=MMETSP0467-20121206/3442_1 /TAXON_ID=283647 /ORGANISM="Mesodinium pulex, Strain SPMC105" /LENGTH=54 /DNA_ID=CAMNT_0004563129 /DNA_START=437 /DNA_END=601 /DNA_ORIENTATION=-
MKVEHIVVKKVDHYIDYIKAGLNINLITGIDFSIYNGLKEDNESLHFLSDKENA